MPRTKRNVRLGLLLSAAPAIALFLAAAPLLATAQSIPSAAPPAPTAVTASISPTPIAESSPGLTQQQQLELQQMLTKMDALDKDVRNDEAQGTPKLLAVTASAGAAIVVGFLALLGVTRQTNAARQASRQDQRQQLAVDRWKQGLDVMEGFENLALEATLQMNKLHEERLDLGLTGRSAKIQERAEEAQRRLLMVDISSARLTTVGVNRELFEIYLSKAAGVIQSAIRGDDYVTLEEAYQDFQKASEDLLSRLREIGASLYKHVSQVEKDLGLSA